MWGLKFTSRVGVWYLTGDGGLVQRASGDVGRFVHDHLLRGPGYVQGRGLAEDIDDGVIKDVH